MFDSIVEPNIVFFCVGLLSGALGALLFQTTTSNGTKAVESNGVCEPFHLQIKKFKPSKMLKTAKCVIVSPEKGGKTWLATDLAAHHPDIDWQMNVGDQIDLHRLEQIIDQQRVDDAPFVGIVLDDCFNRRTFNDAAVQQVFKNGSKLHLMSISTMENAMMLPAEIRAQVGYWFIMYQENVSVRRKLFSGIAGICSDFDVFNALMDSCTDYSCIVIDNTAPRSREFQDRVFWYKANTADFEKVIQ